MDNKRGLIVFLCTFILLLTISSVLADGGFFPKPSYWVRPGQQRAIIFHEDKTETMILMSNFQGNAKELVWIIPTPTKPKVTKANEKVFTNMQKLARPKYTASYNIGYKVMAEAVSGKAADTEVVVIESKQVDYYDVNILLATSSQKLVEWFEENDYAYPEEYAYVLNHYISKGWYFTAIKVSPEAQGSKEVIQDLREGHPTPIKMVFLSEKIVYPLKISSVDFSEGFKISSNLELTALAVSHLKNVGYDDLADSKEGVKIFNRIVADALSDVDYKDSLASNYSSVSYTHLTLPTN